MKYQLLILRIGELTCKEYFLQHIYELVQIPLLVTDTYLDLFDKLKFRFSGDTNRMEAILDFIHFQLDQYKDNDCILHNIVSSQPNSYAIFDLVPVRDIHKCN
jgi:hypothetical protein